MSVTAYAAKSAPRDSVKHRSVQVAGEHVAMIGVAVAALAAIIKL